MREVRRALLEADVALDVVKDFTDKVKAKAVGAEVLRSVTPGQMVVKIVNDEQGGYTRPVWAQVGIGNDAYAAAVARIHGAG